MDLSVLLPVRNGGPYLAEAVESTLSQAGVNMQIVAVDDGSTDGTLDYLKQVSNADGRLEVVKNVGNGLVDALNFGMTRCRAAIVARMDADDVNEAGRFAKQLEFLKGNPDHIAIGTCAINVDDSGQEISRLSLPLAHDAVKRHLEIGCPLLHPSVMFRKEAIVRIGGYRRQFTAAEDLDLWCRAIEVGKLANLSAPLLRYRVHQNSVTSEKLSQLAISSTFARFCMYERRLGREDPASNVGEKVDLQTIERLGSAWKSRYMSYLLYMMSGRRFEVAGMDEAYDAVRRSALDRSMPLQTRRIALYSMLHSKKHRLRALLELAASQPLALVRTFPFIARTKLKI